MQPQERVLPIFNLSVRTIFSCPQSHWQLVQGPLWRITVRRPNFFPEIFSGELFMAAPFLVS
jgi:hypothetical protein